MTPEQFCYWLQGYSELSGPEVPTKAQWDAIRDHLATVFKKVTQPVGLPPGMPLHQRIDWPTVGAEPKIVC